EASAHGRQPVKTGLKGISALAAAASIARRFAARAGEIALKPEDPVVGLPIAAKLATPDDTPFLSFNAVAAIGIVPAGLVPDATDVAADVAAGPRGGRRRCCNARCLDGHVGALSSAGRANQAANGREEIAMILLHERNPR